MEFKRISPAFSASAQLGVADVAKAAEAGFKTIVNNRPDAESADQPPSSVIEAEARREGLAYRHIPVQGGQIGDREIDAMAAMLHQSGGPVLGFCRSGMRSAALWALAEAGRQPADALIAAAGVAGYDLSALRPRLEERRA